MCGYGFGQANPAIKKWTNDPYIGRKIMSFNRNSYSDDRVQLVPDVSYIARNEEGMYGFVGGGTNNIGAFINWCSGLGSWCFNPWTDMDDYVYSEVNEAFMRKSMIGLKDFRVLKGKFYKGDFDSNNNIIRLYSYKWPQTEIIWEKES